MRKGCNGGDEVSEVSMAHSLWVLFYTAINGIAFILYGWDKFCAVRHWWRVSEAILLLLAALGGSIGAWLAMQLFRHKTRHLKFRWGIPMLILLHGAGLILLHIK